MLKTLARVILTTIAIYAVVVVPTGLLKGCSSAALPPKLTNIQREELMRRSPPLPISVGVADYEYPAYSDSLLRILQVSHLFTKVDRLSAFTDPPDFVAEVDRRIYGSAIIPILPAVTLGLVPAWTDEEWGHSFSLKSSRNDAKMAVEFSYHGTSFLGWVSGLINLLPDRTGGDVYETKQYQEAFAFQVLSHWLSVRNPTATE